MDFHIQQTLDALAAMAGRHRAWVATFSGGKDSAAVASLVHWAVKAGHVPRPPRLVCVHSDTGQEFPDLEANAQAMMSALADAGWEVKTVTPAPEDRFYVKVLGRGVPPVHPGMKGRWCTRALKADPMKEAMEAYREPGGKVLVLTGVRTGESASRDDKLEASKARSLPVISCREGGECGLGIWLDEKISDLYDSVNVLSHWTECKVFDWLQGFDRRYAHGLEKYTRRVYAIYKPAELSQLVLDNLRFGCVGCPAVHRDKTLGRYARTDASYGPLRQLYAVWREMRKPWHRKYKVKDGKKKYGPLTVEARRYFLGIVLGIQRESGRRLVTEADLELIQAMHAANVWPRGWTGGEPTGEKRQLELYE